MKLNKLDIKEFAKLGKIPVELGIEDKTLADRYMTLCKERIQQIDAYPVPLGLHHGWAGNQNKYFKVSNIQKSLLNAALAGDKKLIDEAIKNGANPRYSGYSGIPVIYTICVEGSLEIAKYLIEKQPSCVLARTEKGLSPLYGIVTRNMARDAHKDEDKQLQCELINLILNSGEDIDSMVGNGNRAKRTILHICSEPLLLKELLKFKPNPFIKNTSNRTPLENHVSSRMILIDERSYEDISQLLKSYEQEYIALRSNVQSLQWEKYKEEYNKKYPKAQANGYGPGAIVKYRNSTP